MLTVHVNPDRPTVVPSLIPSLEDPVSRGPAARLNKNPAYMMYFVFTSFFDGVNVNKWPFSQQGDNWGGMFDRSR